MNKRYKYSENGYLFKKNFLNKKEKRKIFNYFIDTASNFINVAGINSFESSSLHKRLLNLRKENPKKFGLLYDSLNLNFQLRSIFYSEKMLKIFSDILNVNKNRVFINGFMFRMDAPNDKRNSLSWHQDSRYYQMTFPKYNSGVCWIALTFNTSKNGTLTFIPQSHFEGLVDIKYKKKSKFISEQYKLPLSIKEKRKQKNLNSSFGDLSLFHIHLKHKSGKNISSKIRMVIGCRFHDISSSFNLGKEIYIFNKNGKRRLFN